MTVLRRAVVGACCFALLLAGAGQAAGASGSRPIKTEIDKAVGRCVMVVGVGALLGAVAGNNSGRGHTGRGALIGAAAGGAVCAVLLKVAKDKEAILAKQREAVELGSFQSASFQGKEGPVLVTTKVREADLKPASPDAPLRVCRYADSTVMVPDGGEATLGSQLYCRSDAGDWMVAEAPKDAAAG